MLKDCLLRRFDKTEDDFKQKFRACRPESGETFQKFAVGFLIDGLKCQVLLCIMRIYEI